ncbi:MAG: hypothetical protein M1818_000839 [Claussenomyces sp. TS43310]|nr:MAG: hypothetical protein M1818_000839 [Claussenomyces sp. TS43310]
MAWPAHRNVSNVRPTASGLNASISGATGNLHTPARTTSSAYGSPSALRVEEDSVVLQLGSRYLRAGFAGDALPKAVIDFGPEEQRRAGDFRQWQVRHDLNWRLRRRGHAGGRFHELWNMDLRTVDLSLVCDKIERAVRKAFTKYLLIDSRPRKLILALPTTLPLPLVSTILDALFHTFQPPTISILSEAMLSTAAAGLRSALVVDIGWAETVVTGVYEYREVLTHRSVRASKLLNEEVLRMIVRALDTSTASNREELKATLEPPSRDVEHLWDVVSFEECEEVMQRMAWCRPVETFEDAMATEGLPSVQEEEEVETGLKRVNNTNAGHVDEVVEIPLLSTKSTEKLEVPISTLSEPCEIAYFADGNEGIKWDDEELPLPHLIYQTLLRLPVDVRSICMSRIIFTGGGSNIPGLRSRIIAELKSLIQKRGWDAVSGRAVEQVKNHTQLRAKRSREVTAAPVEAFDDKTGSTSMSRNDTNVPCNAAVDTQEADPIEEQFRQGGKSGSNSNVQGALRAVFSMGAWSGASLLSHLKVPAVSLVEREQWLQHGAAGASKQNEVTMICTRQSIGPGGLRAGAGDRTSWTLGSWG